MYLKRLELSGFKTFADKIDLELPRGFLAVVGPNGSGKSNLTDALRFCLGEQSLKVLRANKAEELIFAGTNNRRPAPFCEVSAVFDNSDGHLPVDFAEVSITRRIERSGDTKYFINRTTCRLKDIHELLMGGGIGPGSFSVLGGREVDRVLSTDPRERRMMLEETAGVNRYRFRKQEAERRLQRTAANLTRLKDILIEVEQQWEESKKQLARYERYKKAQDELKELDCQVAHFDYSQLEGKRALLQVRVEELEGVATASAASEAELSARLELLQEARATREAERERQGGELAAMREESVAKKAAYDGLFGRARDLEHSARVAEERLQAAQDRLTLRSHDLDRLGRERPRLLAEVTEAEERVKKLRAEWEALPLPGHGAHGDLRAKLQQLDQELSRLMARVESLQTRLDTDQRRMDEIEALSLAALGEAGEAVDLAPLVADAEERLKAALERQKELQNAWTASEKDLMDSRNNRKVLENERRPLFTRCTELESFLEDRSGMPAAVRAVMAWKQPGTVGLVGELIKVREGMEVAVEAALGGHMHDVITRDRSTASGLIDRLKQERIGRVTFWPLDLSRKAAPKPELPSRQGVVGLALELIGYPKEILPVLEEMLGRTVFMEDLPSALALYDRGFGRRPHLVTLQGEYLSPSGALTGGSLAQNRSNLLTRRRQLDDARAALTGLEKRLQEQQEREEHVQKMRYELERQKALLDEEVRRLRQEVGDLTAQQRRHEADQERSTRALEKLEAERAELVRRGEQWAAELTQSDIDRERLQAEQEKTRDLQAQNQEEEARRQVARERMQQQVLEAELDLQRCQQRQQELDRELASIKARADELAADQDQARAEQERCLQARKDLETEGAQLQQDLARLEVELATRSTALEELKSSLAALDRELGELKKQHHEVAASAAEQGRKLHSLQVELAGVQARAEEALARVEELGLSLDEPPELPEGIDLDKIRTQAQRVKSYLENFGSVNLGAREDFERLQGRQADLTTQIADLEEGSASLRQIMAEMDAATVEQFQASFTAVNDTFSRMYTELFGGGTAQLELTNPADVLESGVEIVARPPGKKVQNLTLMSSGERALSAIAFLLALLAHRPSPIVILDELDAPLDDSNVEKVAARLLEFSTSSQFLCITHNRKTMEFADRLYGVTMEEPGVSRMLTVTLSGQPASEPQAQQEVTA